MKTVAFVVTSLDPGGIENYLLRFLKFSVGKFKPLVICKSGLTGDLESRYLEIPEIEIMRIKVGYFNIFTYLKLRRVFKRFGVAVVCDFTGNFAGGVLSLARALNIPVRIAFYRGAAIRFSPTKVRLLYNFFMNFLVKRFATRILSNSIAALDVFYPDRNEKDGRFKVIYNGVDSHNFLRPPDDDIKKELNIPDTAFIVGHVGRNDLSKNLRIIGEVARVICPIHADIYFVLCGKGTESFIRDFTAEVPELKNRLLTFGYRQDVHRILKIYDLFIFPSIIEGQPNALIEAFIADLPVVASDIPSIIETTPKQLRPYLQDPTNVMGFVDQIERCYLDEAFRDGLKCREWAINQFNPDILFTEFLNELTN